MTADIAPSTYPCGALKPRAATVDTILLHWSQCADPRCAGRWVTHCEGATMFRRAMGQPGGDATGGGR